MTPIDTITAAALRYQECYEKAKQSNVLENVKIAEKEIKKFLKESLQVTNQMGKVRREYGNKVADNIHKWANKESKKECPTGDQTFLSQIGFYASALETAYDNASSNEAYKSLVQARKKYKHEVTRSDDIAAELMNAVFEKNKNLTEHTLKKIECWIKA